MRTLRIRRHYYDYIVKGDKTLEVRVGYGSIRRFATGEVISLQTSQVSTKVRVKDVRTYKSFADALAAEPWERIIPDATSLENALEVLQTIYPPRKEALGVYVFEIEVIK